MKNTLPVQPAGRAPRGLIQVNGASVPWISFEVDNNTFYAADTFRVTLPVNALPLAVPLDLLFGTADLFVEVFAGFPQDPTKFTAADLQSLIYGKADEVTWSLDETEIEICGRDLTSAMIDVKSTEKYPNQTSSEIVTKIAQTYGLTPVVTATTTKVGRYYQIDHVRSQDDRTVWDLVTWLAREEGFVAYVQGQSLYFQPAPQQSQDPYVVTWNPSDPAQSSAQRVKVAHAKTLAKDIIVKVHSWNRKQAKVFTVEAKASHIRNGVTARGSIKTGQPQVYDYVIPNLDKGQAQARANQLAAEISKHEIKISIEGPADDILQRTDVIQLRGTPADTIYYPASIVREMDFEGGYCWRIEAKNHGPETQVDL